jgi:hypothetical protein
MENNEGESEAARQSSEILTELTELAERLGRIDPNLVATLSSRKKAPQKLRGEEGEEGVAADFTTSFRDFDDGPAFVNAFAKAGDGFINIHSVVEEVVE